MSIFGYWKSAVYGLPLLGLAVSMALAGPTRCVGADGSIAFVQGACPAGTVSAESVTIYDTDAASYNPAAAARSAPSPEPQPSSGRAIFIGSDPCRSNALSEEQKRRDRKACKAVSIAKVSGQGSSNPACRDLQREDIRRNASPVALRALMAQCNGSSAPAAVPVPAATVASPPTSAYDDRPRCSRLAPSDRSHLISQRMVVPGMLGNDVWQVVRANPQFEVALDDGSVQRTYTTRNGPRTIIAVDECVIWVSDSNW